MSTKEMCHNLLDAVPEYKLGYLLAYIQGLVAEEEDERYCEELYREYLQDPANEESFSLAQCKEEWRYLQIVS